MDPRAFFSLGNRSFMGVAGVAVGVISGWVCQRIGTPIPWMLGPLFTLAALRVIGIPLRAPFGARESGQWIIGTSLGLYFTPQVVHEIGGWWFWLIAGAAFSIAVGYLTGMALARLAGIDRTTAFFASVPGGATEMSVLSRRFGGRVDRVAAAQSLRILIVVGIVPAAFAMLNLQGGEVYVPGAKVFAAPGFALLMGATGIGALIAERFHIPNAFILGALAISIALTASGIDLSAMPPVVSNVGQCLLGCALGSRFGPEFLKGVHRFVGAVALSVLLAIALSAAFGASIAWLSGLGWATLVLGTAPGGIAEMCVTAKAMRLGVPVVTAFHVVRVVVLLLLTAPLFALLRRWREGDRTA